MCLTPRSREMLFDGTLQLCLAIKSPRMGHAFVRLDEVFAVQQIYSKSDCGFALTLKVGKVNP